MLYVLCKIIIQLMNTNYKLLLINIYTVCWTLRSKFATITDRSICHRECVQSIHIVMLVFLWCCSAIAHRSNVLLLSAMFHLPLADLFRVVFSLRIILLTDYVFVWVPVTYVILRTRFPLPLQSFMRTHHLGPWMLLLLCCGECGVSKGECGGDVEGWVWWWYRRVNVVVWWCRGVNEVVVSKGECGGV